MANNIKVSLIKSQNGDLVLDVDQKGTSHVLCRLGAQDIHWKLVEDQPTHQSLGWEPMGTSRPGFVWITTPPDGYFDEPTIGSGNNSKQLTMRAHHLTQASTGCWIYMLRIRDLISQKVYSTTVSATSAVDPNPQGRCGDDPAPQGTNVTLAVRVSDNPIIINR